MSTKKKSNKKSLREAVAADRNDMLSPTYSVREAKGKVMELEKKNYSSVILWRSTYGWWKMCENSTLIYYYIVAPLINREPKIHVDTDRYFNSHAGIISLPEDGMEKLEALLKPHGIEKSPHSTASIMSFTLPKAIPKEQIEAYRIEEKGLFDRINEILSGENIEQYMTSEIHKVTSILYTLTKRMDDHRKWFIGYKMVDRILNISIIKNDMERKKISRRAATEEILSIIDQLMAFCTILLDMRMIDTYKMEGLAKHLYNIRTECNRIIAEEVKLMRQEGKN